MSSFRPALLVLLLALPLLGGCFQLRTLLRLDADGSGTIEETVAFSSELRPLYAAEHPEGLDALYDEDALRDHADELGDGVTFVGVDTLAEAGVFGYRAVYRFDDVRRVAYRYNDRPIAGAGSEGLGESPFPFIAGMDLERPVTFDFAPGRLTVRMPAVSQGQTPAALDPAEVADLAEDLRARFATFSQIQQESDGEDALLTRVTLASSRFSIAVALPAPVAGGTATHVEGATVTLSDVSFRSIYDLIGEKPELFARAVMLESEGTPDARPLLRALANHPDVRYELQPEVEVRW